MSNGDLTQLSERVRDEIRLEQWSKAKESLVAYQEALRDYTNERLPTGYSEADILADILTGYTTMDNGETYGTTRVPSPLALRSPSPIAFAVTQMIALAHTSYELLTRGEQPSAIPAQLHHAHLEAWFDTRSIYVNHTQAPVIPLFSDDSTMRLHVGRLAKHLIQETALNTACHAKVLQIDESGAILPGPAFPALPTRGDVDMYLASAD